MKKVFVIGSVLILTLCGTKDHKVAETLYDLRNPVETILLQERLVEISGIAFYKNKLHAVHDEKSKLFELNKDDGKVVGTIELDKVRDYEGLTFHKDNCYITTSKGKIITVNMKDKSLEKTDQHFLDGYDVEGFVYDTKKKTFLLACKDYGSDKEKFEGKRIVFELDLRSNKLNPDPVLLLKKKALNAFIHEKYKTKKDREFKPSGLAFHPRSGDLYVLSSKSRAVMVFDRSFQLKDIMLMKSSVIQPEGICFDKDLTLYISSEGGGFGPAKLFKFTPIKN